jgi:hypothetical protein
VTVDCLIEAIEAARETWDFVLGLVPSGAWETVDPSTGWSIKDQVAHVAWHELEMVGLLESKAFEGPPWWLADTDGQDTDIHEEYKDAALADVLTMAEGAHTRLVEALEELDDEELDDPSYFKNMPSDWTPWHLVAANTCQHYAEHAFAIRRTLRAFRSE